MRVVEGPLGGPQGGNVFLFWIDHAWRIDPWWLAARGTMSETSPDTPSSRWIAWTLSALAVPVVYVLTLPPLYYSTTPRLEHDTGSIMWRYSRPYAWLARSTPLKEALMRYNRYWAKRLWSGRKP